MPSDKSKRQKAIEDMSLLLSEEQAALAKKAILNLPQGTFEDEDEDKPKTDINGVTLNKGK